VNVVGHAVDLERYSLLTSNQASQIAVQSFFERGGDQGLAMLRREDEMVEKIGERLGHEVILNSSTEESHLWKRRLGIRSLQDFFHIATAQSLTQAPALRAQRHLLERFPRVSLRYTLGFTRIARVAG
jgi:hypothetical protein